MSMASGCGASAAAQEIITFINKQVETIDSDSEAYAELMKVRKLSEEIKQAGDSGWY